MHLKSLVYRPLSPEEEEYSDDFEINLQEGQKLITLTGLIYDDLHKLFGVNIEYRTDKIKGSNVKL